MKSLQYFSKYVLFPVAGIHLGLNLDLELSHRGHITVSNTSPSITDSDKTLSIINKIKAYLTNLRGTSDGEDIHIKSPCVSGDVCSSVVALETV